MGQQKTTAIPPSSPSWLVGWTIFQVGCHPMEWKPSSDRWGREVGFHPVAAVNGSLVEATQKTQRYFFYMIPKIRKATKQLVMSISVSLNLTKSWRRWCFIVLFFSSNSNLDSRSHGSFERWYMYIYIYCYPPGEWSDIPPQMRESSEHHHHHWLKHTLQWEICVGFPRKGFPTP